MYLLLERVLGKLSIFENHLESFNPTGRKEGNVLFNDALNTFYFMVIWRQIAREETYKVVGLTSCRKEMFYLTTHLTHFILRLYGIRHMVKDHSDSEKGNPLLPHRLLFPINSKGSFICTIPQTVWHIPRPLLHQLWSTGWNEK